MISFFVPGKPQGKGRARSRVATSKKTGKLFTTHYTPAKTRDYELTISKCAAVAMSSSRAEMISSPVHLELLIVMPIPDSWPEWKKADAMAGLIRPTVKPDSDNVEKAVKDGCNGIVWVDDSYVVESHKDKRYTNGTTEVGVHVFVDKLNSLPAQIKHKPENHS